MSTDFPLKIMLQAFSCCNINLCNTPKSKAAPSHFTEENCSSDVANK